MAKLVPLEDIKKEKFRYLWKPYMPYGMVSIFQGQCGYGKTSLICRIMAEASQGIFPPRLRRGGINYEQAGEYLTAELAGEMTMAQKVAAQALKELLIRNHGRVDSKDVMKMAEEKKIPVSTLNEVKKMLGVRSERGRGNASEWVSH